MTCNLVKKLVPALAVMFTLAVSWSGHAETVQYVDNEGQPATFEIALGDFAPDGTDLSTASLALLEATLRSAITSNPDDAALIVCAIINSAQCATRSSPSEACGEEFFNQLTLAAADVTGQSPQSLTQQMVAQQTCAPPSAVAALPLLPTPPGFVGVPAGQTVENPNQASPG